MSKAVGYVIVVIVLVILIYGATWLLPWAAQKHVGEAEVGIGAVITPYSPPAGGAIVIGGTAAVITGQVRGEKEAEGKEKAKQQEKEKEQQQ